MFKHWPFFSPVIGVIKIPKSVTSGKAGGLERREPPKAVELLEPAKKAGAYLNNPN